MGVELTNPPDIFSRRGTKMKASSKDEASLVYLAFWHRFCLPLRIKAESKASYRAAGD
jgi:hypothetical protein